MNKKQILDADLIAAKNLQRLWELWQTERVSLGLGKMSQEKAGLDMSMTQGAVSQYLLGKTPLGTEATLKFAKLLNVKPTDIRTDFAYLSDSSQDMSEISSSENIENLSEEAALVFADEFERILEVKLTPADKRELFQRMRSRYLRQLNAGQQIPKTEEEMTAEVIDFSAFAKIRKS